MSTRLYLFAVIAGLSVAQARAAENPAGYLLNGSRAPVTSASGGCVHTAEWTGAGYGQCDPHAVVVEAPAPIQVAREPAPVAAQTPAPEAPPVLAFKVSMDTLFDFDSADLRADADAALDELATQLTQADYPAVNIVGHADRIGRAKYNQQLSERRAAAVREYLAARGIDGSKIAVSGVGSSEPVTGSQCKGLRGSRLITCLQPDRFAEVTVTGTQTSAMR